MIKERAIKGIERLKELSKELVNAELKKGVKFSKEQIFKDLNLFIKFLELSNNDNFKECYPLIKDIEKIINKYALDLDEEFKLFKEMIIIEYRKTQI